MSNYIVLDLEMCRLRDSEMSVPYSLGTEIIQIGAAKLNEGFEVIDTFNSYVKPEYGYLDAFIKQLTGITDINVNTARCLNDVLIEFAEFVGDGDVKTVSWSLSDYKQLRTEMYIKNIRNERVENMFNNWIDCQKEFGDKLNSTRCYALQEALMSCDINTIGSCHDGFSDAYNTAMLFTKMKTEPNFELNELYRLAREEENISMTFSMGRLFEGIDLAGLPA